jgi:hypothetical protein
MGWAFDQMVSWLAAAVLAAFDTLFAAIAKVFLVSPDVTALPQVQALTGRSVWVVDTVFVLAFVTAGVLTITAGGEERARYTVKDLAPRLVVGFVAAHFSTLLCGQAIGLANGLTDGLTPGDTNPAGAFDAIKTHVHGAAADQAAGLLFLVLIALITVLLAATMLGMLGRFAALLVLTAVAPLALACHALPHTVGLARLWWRLFGGCLATPVLQGLTLQAGQWMLEDPAHLLPSLGLPHDPAGMINLLVVVVLLWTTVKIPAMVRRYAAQGGRGTTLGAIVRVVVVQQLTRAVPGLGRGVRTVAR